MILTLRDFKYFKLLMFFKNTGKFSKSKFSGNQSESKRLKIWTFLIFGRVSSTLFKNLFGVNQVSKVISSTFKFLENSSSKKRSINFDGEDKSKMI